MVEFQKNNELELNDIEISKRVKEIYELKENKETIGYATINEDNESLIYVYVKKEYRGNRIWENNI